MKNRILIFLMVLFSGLAACPPPPGPDSETEGQPEPFDHLAERNPAAEIAHLYPPAVAADKNPPSLPHDEFVDAVVDNLFQ